MKKSLRKFVNRIGKKRFATLFALIFCMPIMIWSFYSGGFPSLAAAIVGFVVGQLISNKFIKY